MSFGGGSSGGGSISSSSDVFLSSPQDNQVLTYNAGTLKWVNATNSAAPVTSVSGKTGAVTIDKTDVGLANVDNTSDANKPISSAVQAALNAKATDAAVVHLSGDTMTGTLNVQVANNATALSATTPTPASDNVYLSLNGRARFGYSGTNGSVYFDDNATGKAIQFNASSAQVLRLNGTSGNNGANYAIINNGAAGAGVTVTAGGSDTNIPITITPKGSGATILKNVNISSGAVNGYVLTSDASGNATWQAGAGGGGGSSLVLPSIKTSSYTLALADAGTAIEMNSASAVTVTVPPSSSVSFPIGTIIEIFQRGAGQVTVVAGANVTLRTAATAVLRAQYSVATLRLTATDEWVLAGDLV